MGNSWTLGLPFLRAFYSIYELGRDSRIGLINIHDLPEEVKTAVPMSDEERMR